LYDGWNIYRSFLNNLPQLRGNQINTWNGQWLAHRYDNLSYYPEDPTANLNPFEVKDGIMEIKTQSWVIILARLARQLNNPQLMGYVYNLGQTNTTLGFIPFLLPKIRKPFELYKKIFGESDYTERYKQLETLFGTAHGFTKICQLGVIGIEALEPKGLKEMVLNAKTPTNYEDKTKELTYNIYQIWILAMLNNDTLWNHAQQIALDFHFYASGAENAKKDRSNNLKILLASMNKKQFIENLIPIVEETVEKGKFEEIAKLINVMPSDNVPYFLTLIRFQFAVQNK